MNYYGVQIHHILKAIAAILSLSLTVFFVKLYRIRKKMIGLVRNTPNSKLASCQDR
jgi:hypothetical protein